MAPRIPWMTQELAYMYTWMSDKIRANPAVASQVVSKCLNHMKRDPAAYPIFHRNHVINGETLRHGYRKLTKMAASERNAREIVLGKNESQLLGLSVDIINRSVKADGDDQYY
jgi:hypothetical protein